jgi:hypothetical protein
LLVADKDLLVRTKGSTIASIASITLIALGHSHLGGHILLVARRELFGAEVGGRGGAAGMSQETGEAASAGDGVEQGEGDHKDDSEREHQAKHEPTLERARERWRRDERAVGFSES